MCEEKADVDENVVVKVWEEKLLNLTEGYPPSNIYIVDETGLFCLKPDQSFCFRNEKGFDGKETK